MIRYNKIQFFLDTGHLIIFFVCLQCFISFQYNAIFSQPNDRIISGIMLKNFTYFFHLIVGTKQCSCGLLATRDWNSNGIWTDDCL